MVIMVMMVMLRSVCEISFFFFFFFLISLYRVIDTDLFPGLLNLLLQTSGIKNNALRLTVFNP